MMPRYAKVSVPAPLVQRLRALIDARPELGYRSPSDALTECLRQRLRELDDIAPAVAEKRAHAPGPRAGERLWIPTCDGCSGPTRRLLYLPGDARGPVATERLYVHWSCTSCGARNFLPSNRWVPA